MHKTRHRLAACGSAVRVAPAAAAVLLMLAGCIPEGRTTDECEQVAGFEVPPDAPIVALVVDNTASGAPGRLPPAVAEAIAAAQADGSGLLIIPVAGAEHHPAPVHRVFLDPYPGEKSQTATNARQVALSCVAGWAMGERARPAGPGSAILEAISAASRQRPTRILVVSDGLANSGALDLNQVGFDADPVAVGAELERALAFDPNLDGLEILWGGLGDSAEPLPQPARTSLQQLWQQVLTAAGARVTFDPRPAPVGTTPPAESLPEDGVRIPASETVQLRCGVEVTVPAALLFGPDSARLQAGAAEELRGIAQQLAAHPDWAATVSGHTADYGTERGRLRLSRERAAVVKAELVRLGADPAQIEARGFGATRPAPPGGPLGDSPARHRRVVIEIQQAGCGV